MLACFWRSEWDVILSLLMWLRISSTAWNPADCLPWLASEELGFTLATAWLIAKEPRVSCANPALVSLLAGTLLTNLRGTATRRGPWGRTWELTFRVSVSVFSPLYYLDGVFISNAAIALFHLCKLIYPWEQWKDEYKTDVLFLWITMFGKR